MSRRQEPWTGKDTAESVAVVVMMLLATAACTGNLSIADMGAYAQTAQQWAGPVALGASGVLLGLGVLLVAIRHLRVWLVAAARALYLYRRRWARVLTDLGLTETTGEHTKVPRLVSVQRHGEQDVVAVRMLPGQSLAAFHGRAAALAAEFGASSARIAAGKHPHKDVVIVFDRSRAPKGPQLALPAPQPHPLPLYLPGRHQEQQRQADPGYAIRLSGLRLHIVWARVQRIEKNEGGVVRAAGRARYGLRGGIEVATWATAS